MELSSTGPLVWAKDEEGHRCLCPLDLLSDPNHVSSEEKSQCIDDDTRLQTKEYVPSNEPEGKISFTDSVSPN
jgi:hypothetical protein